MEQKIQETKCKQLPFEEKENNSEFKKKEQTSLHCKSGYEESEKINSILQEKKLEKTLLI